MTPLDIHLRPAVAADLDAILNLERATEYAPHWPRATYAAVLKSSERCLIVAEALGEIAGFAVGLVRPVVEDSGRLAELESVAVSPHLRRAGIGRALCSVVIDWCRSQSAGEIILEVRTASAGAIALYSALGFTHAGSRPRYYRDPGDDALLMRLSLAS